MFHSFLIRLTVKLIILLVPEAIAQVSYGAMAGGRDAEVWWTPPDTSTTGPVTR